MNINTINFNYEWFLRGRLERRFFYILITQIFSMDSLDK